MIQKEERETFMSVTVEGNQTGVIGNERKLEHVLSSRLIY